MKTRHKDSFENQPSLQLFKYQQYNKAIRGLQLLFSQPPNELTVICCTMFVLLERLCEHHAAALIHFRAAVTILTKLSRHSLQHQQGMLLVPLSVLRRYNLQAVFYGSTDLTDTGLHLDITAGTPCSLAAFSDMVEATNALDAILLNSWKFVVSLRDTVLGSAKLGAAKFVQRHLLEQCDWWHRNLNFMLERLNLGLGSLSVGIHADRILLLYVQHGATSIMLNNILSDTELTWDEHFSDFASLVQWTSQMSFFSPNLFGQSPHLAATPRWPPVFAHFVVDTSVSPVLWLTATKCRDPAIRRQALSLMRLVNPQMRDRSGGMYVRCAERVIEIEEQLSTTYDSAARLPIEAARLHRVEFLDGQGGLTDQYAPSFQVRFTRRVGRDEQRSATSWIETLEHQ